MIGPGSDKNYSEDGGCSCTRIGTKPSGPLVLVCNKDTRNDFFLLLALVKRGGLKECNTNEGKMEERKGTIAWAFCY